MKLIYRLLLIFAFIICLGIVIAYARGYRIDFNKKTVSSTGILAINSNPQAAKVYINGELKGATNMNLGLPPDPYNIEIKKDGYTSWSKKIILKGELVISLDALLFPLNPSLSPLTNLGVVKAVPLDQTDKILLFTDNNDPTKDGVYLFDAGRKPLSLSAPLKLILLKKYLPQSFNFATAITYLSPDFKQAIIEFPLEKTKNSLAYILSLEEENTNVFDITNSKETLLAAWKKEKGADQLKILETFPKEIIKIATDSFHIISFSPNETKLFYQATKPTHLPIGINPPLIATNQTKEQRDLKKDHFYIYDLKEDKNYEVNLASIIRNLTSNKILNSELSILNSIQWYPDSKHFVLNNNKKISVIEYDGDNKQVIYSGPFDESFFTVTSDGNLITLSNLNPETNKFPDLYAVGIK